MRRLMMRGVMIASSEVHIISALYTRSIANELLIRSSYEYFYPIFNLNRSTIVYGSMKNIVSYSYKVNNVDNNMSTT
jgi:hypothetical protein